MTFVISNRHTEDEEKRSLNVFPSISPLARRIIRLSKLITSRHYYR